MKIRAKLGYSTGGHTGGDVYLGVYAPAGVAKLRGTVDNTELPMYIASNLNLDLNLATKTLYEDMKTRLALPYATPSINIDTDDNSVSSILFSSTYTSTILLLAIIFKVLFPFLTKK